MNTRDYFIYVEKKEKKLEISSAKFLVKSENSDIADINDGIPKKYESNVKGIRLLDNQLFVIDLQDINVDDILDMVHKLKNQKDIVYT